MFASSLISYCVMLSNLKCTIVRFVIDRSPCSAQLDSPYAHLGGGTHTQLTAAIGGRSAHAKSAHSQHDGVQQHKRHRLSCPATTTGAIQLVASYDRDQAPRFSCSSRKQTYITKDVLAAVGSCLLREPQKFECVSTMFIGRLVSPVLAEWQC